MAQLTLRGTKGVPLTNAEVDSNFEALNLDLQSLADSKVSKVLGKNLSDQNFSGNEKAKLAGIAPNATANESDEFLLDRANHTGTQSISTIDNLQDELDSKVDKVTGYGLSEKNFTTAEKNKLSGLSNFSEAPSDGKQYARKDGAWDEIVILPGSYVPATTHTTAPTDGVDTDNPYLYYNQTTGVAKMYLRTGGGVYIEMGSAQVDPGTPPEEIDPNAMLLGLNTTWINDYSTDGHFANLMYSARTPERVFGSGTYSTLRGNVTTDDPNTVSRIILGTGTQLEVMSEYTTGDKYSNFTVRNPDGLKMKIWTYGGGDEGASAAGVDNWTTATEFTISAKAPNGTPWGGGALCLFVEGPITSTLGNIEIILPGHVESYDSGNIWRDACLAFYTQSKQKVLRFLDFTSASVTPETDWADRVLLDAPKFATGWASFQDQCTPWEVCFDLCNRTNSDAWINVPYRATQDYVEKFAALAKAKLNAPLKIYVEHANEAWNWATPWGAGYYWCQYLDFTKYKATANYVAQNFTLTGHGWSNGAQVRIWNSKENLNGTPFGGEGYTYGNTGGFYVKRIDADTFELYDDVDLTAKRAIPTQVVKITVVNINEAGKTPNRDGNFAALSKRNWDIFDAEFVGERSRLVHVMASHAAASSTTADRLADPTIKAATDAVAIAPYFNGAWFAMELAPGSGSIRPNWWASEAMPNITIGVYADGSNPTIAQVLAGSGSGFVSKQTLNFTVAGLPKVDGNLVFNTNGTNVTGLTNDTAYKVIAVGTLASGLAFRLEGTATPAATDAIKVTVTDSFANQAVRNRHDTATSKRSMIQATATAAAGVPIICYEGGNHSNEDAPKTVENWYNDYIRSSEYADFMKYYLRAMQQNGIKEFTWYAAVRPGIWAVAEFFSEINTDNRVVAFKSLNGYVNPTIGLLPNTLIAVDPVATEPPSYPANIFTFDDPTANYAIVGGNDRGRFDINAGKLRLVDATGVDFGDPTAYSLLIEQAKDGTSAFRQANLMLGDSWYELDAEFVFDSYYDTDTANLDPKIGNSIALGGTTGSVTVSDGIWTLGGDRVYTGAGKLLHELDKANDIFIAVVMKFGESSPTYSTIFQIGGYPNLAIIQQGGGKMSWDLNKASGNVGIESPYSRANTGPNVYWCVLRGGDTLTIGMDQTVHNTASANSAISSTIGRNVQLMQAQGYGSIQVLQRASITDAEAKAIVAKMQTLHGIA